MALLGSITASTTTQFNLSFVPQNIILANITTVTRVRVTALGKGIILDLDAAGLAALKNMRQQGPVTGTAEFLLANGVVKATNCTIEITNGATVSTLYYNSLADSKDATVYVVSKIQTIFANSLTKFEKFAVLALPSFGTSDYANLEFNDGLVSRVDQPELRTILAKFQTVENNINDLKIDNLDAWIKSAELQTTTQQSVYVQTYDTLA
jgi:hypothetical protein